MKTTLDLALTRWSVMCIAWHDQSAGHHPQLGAFLAGWFRRDMGMPLDEPPNWCRDSYRVGYREADNMIKIQQREESHRAAELH